MRSRPTGVARTAPSIDRHIDERLSRLSAAESDPT
jgi:hypothetical protein